jgi:hypothetical protein
MFQVNQRQQDMLGWNHTRKVILNSEVDIGKMMEVIKEVDDGQWKLLD